MNKKSVILAVNLMLFFSSCVLPTTLQQELDDAVESFNEKKSNAVLEAIYAADKASELAPFAQDKYIQVLERKNEELQAKKSKCNGLFEKISHNMDFWPKGADGLGLDAHGLELVKWKANLLNIPAGSLKILGYASFMYMLYLPFQVMFTQLNVPMSIADFDKANRAYQMKVLLSFMSGCLCAMSRQEVLRIQRDCKIDALIEKNQTIIAQLQEIQQVA